MMMADRLGTSGGGARLPVEFRGRSRDYFGIWIVNILLTMITLGIYSAWAKVRRMQFFYGNTRVAGDGFAYTARPVVILKGRLIALAVIVALAVVQQFLPVEYQGLLPLVLLPLYPWAINQSMRFNARVTVWRNIRFDWLGTYGRACKVLFLWPLAALLTFGVAFPFAARALREFIANNHRFGTARFSAATAIGPYYIALGLSILAFLAVIAAAALPALLAFDRDELAYLAMRPEQLSFVPLALIVGIYFAGSIFFARTRNVLIRALVLEGGHRFDCDLSGLKLIWIRISNLIAVVLSLGLLWPWASTRTWRYLAQAMAVLPAGPLDDFAASQAAPGSAAVAEFADIEGLDVAL